MAYFAGSDGIEKLRPVRRRMIPARGAQLFVKESEGTENAADRKAA